MTCRWNGSDKPRTITGRHGYDCAGDECPGCQPCTEPHCRVCGRTHADGTCAECMAATRETLHEIARMCDALPEEVESRGIEGEAMMLLGPAADPEARGHLEASVLAGRVDRDALETSHLKGCEDPTCTGCAGELHPLFVLGSWDAVWRDALEHDEPTGRITIADAVDYLDRTMTYMGGYEHVPFEDFARDLRACRAHLEAVLHDGEQVEHGAPCLTCKRPVTRTTSDDGKVTFTCEPCRRTLTDNEYRLTVRSAHLAHADRLTADDLAIRISVPASSIRRWASSLRIQRRGEEPVEHPPLLRSCGRDGRGRKVYRVDDALTIRDAGGDRRRSAIVSNEGAA